jgi:hypothetical protein
LRFSLRELMELATLHLKHSCFQASRLRRLALEIELQGSFKVCTGRYTEWFPLLCCCKNTLCSKATGVQFQMLVLESSGLSFAVIADELLWTHFTFALFRHS